jgi:hypothetical protein
MNIKTFVAILITVVIGVIATYLVIVKPPCIFKPAEALNSFDECIGAGYPILESYPRQCKTPNGKTFVEDIGNELEKINLIQITKPRPNETIQSPLEIKGEARGYWFFEADFPVKLLDENGELIASGIAQAQGDWMTEDFVPFESILEFEVPETDKGVLILEKDNPSGLPENADELRIPVRFNLAETIKVKVYFNNDRMDPEFSCNKVFPVEREIPKTQTVGRAALEELLKGSTEAEKNQGFFTSINSGVKIQSLSIKDGVAKVDFDEQLEFQVGGSCRVAAIRAQITETLKQFPTVDNVIISIDGRTEDILQP